MCFEIINSEHNLLFFQLLNLVYYNWSCKFRSTNIYNYYFISRCGLYICYLENKNGFIDVCKQYDTSYVMQKYSC